MQSRNRKYISTVMVKRIASEKKTMSKNTMKNKKASTKKHRNKNEALLKIRSTRNQLIIIG